LCAQPFVYVLVRSAGWIWRACRLGADRCQFVMQLSTDLRYICGGSVVMRRPRTVLDGSWAVRWEGGQAANIVIDGGSWSLFGTTYRLSWV
jgi:hypothetical protein